MNYWSRITQTVCGSETWMMCSAVSGMMIKSTCSLKLNTWDHCWVLQRLSPFQSLPITTMHIICTIICHAMERLCDGIFSKCLCFAMRFSIALNWNLNFDWVYFCLRLHPQAATSSRGTWSFIFNKSFNRADFIRRKRIGMDCNAASWWHERSLPPNSQFSSI